MAAWGWKAALAASLVLNAGLAVGLYLKTGDTREFYRQKALDATYSQTVKPEPSPEVLGQAPERLVGYEEANLIRLTPPRLALQGQTPAALARWQQDRRAAIRRVLAFDPGLKVVDARPTERTSFPTVTREKLYLKTSSGIWLPAYLMVPRQAAGRRPAVLAIPGHDALVAKGARAIAGQDYPGNYMQTFGLRLAEAGYVVLALDVAGIGELASLGYQRLFTGGLLRDDPMLGLMLEQVHAATGYMLERPEVDPARVGTMGVSLGGELAMFAGAIDPRVSFVVSSGFFGSYREFPVHSYPNMFVPGILKEVDLYDVAALVAPRPLLVQLGAEDTVPGASISKQKAYFETVQAAYRTAGVPEAAALDLHPGGHVMAVAPALEWLERMVPISARSAE